MIWITANRLQSLNVRQRNVIATTRCRELTQTNKQLLSAFDMNRKLIVEVLSFMKKTIATVALAGAAIAGTASNVYAETNSGFFLAYSPGRYVQYIALDRSGRDVSGYLEAISVSPNSPDGQARTQTFAKRDGDSLVFGDAVASTTSQGYVVSATAPNGFITQVRFLPASPRDVNAAIAALSASASRARYVSERSAASAEVRSYSKMSVEDSDRLAAAQSAIETAAAQLSDSQRAGERLSAVARQARLDADAAVNRPGVSYAQNQSRLIALRIAEDAEQAVVVAQHVTDVASTVVGTARAEVGKLRLQFARAALRAQAIATRLAPGDAPGR